MQSTNQEVIILSVKEEGNSGREKKTIEFGHSSSGDDPRNVVFVKAEMILFKGHPDYERIKMGQQGIMVLVLQPLPVNDLKSRSMGYNS